ncbi:taurine catabolism dioxygenase [Scheffersomyces xylosifermentans]|uniref:taurine catabolism dioxygenase n=1 Tax=Scheffersomyces xylosifermentans TaxID=1304137 RepID=UPI00315D5CFF
MAPVAAATRYDPSQFNKEHNAITESGAFTISKQNSQKAKFPDFLPTWNPDQKFPPLKFFEFTDKGTLGDANYANLLPENGDFKTKSITPKFGTEIRGVQLSQLDDKAKNDLALLVAKRGVVVFRDQDFSSYGPEFAVNYGRYFGPLHVHPTSGSPEGFPQLHITFRGASKTELESAFQSRTNNIAWHSDVSYELNPPQITFFTVLEGPEAGGDTIFADTVEAYKRLSPAMQKILEGLHVLHTAEDQANINQAIGGVCRRKPVANIHPLVRQHPVTREKFLFLNREFGRRIVELKEEESESLLEFLFNHVESAHDLQLRANWEPNTVVLWDNRRTVHSAVIDWDTPVLRHAFRISPQGERPVEDLKDLNDEGYLKEKYATLGR